jgi:hypothetical protein
MDEIARCADRDGSPQAHESMRDARLRFALHTRDVESARTLLRPRLAEILGSGEDPWRTTAFTLYAAWLAAMEKAPGTDEAVRVFLAAFDACPHDEPFSLHAMAELERALDEDAPYVTAIRERRRARLARARREPP